MTDDEWDERCELTRYLYDLDWDSGQRAEVQEYLAERLELIGGPMRAGSTSGSRR